MKNWLRENQRFWDHPFYLQVDVVICDIPFGRQYGTIEGCRDTLYKAVLESFSQLATVVKLVQRSLSKFDWIFVPLCVCQKLPTQRMLGEKRETGPLESTGSCTYGTVQRRHSPMHSTVCLLHSCQKQTGNSSRIWSRHTPSGWWVKIMFFHHVFTRSLPPNFSLAFLELAVQVIKRGPEGRAILISSLEQVLQQANGFRWTSSFAMPRCPYWKRSRGSSRKPSLKHQRPTFPVKKLKLMSFETSNKSKFKTFTLQF